MLDKATHAWIYQTTNGSEIRGSGPVDGTNASKTSHRAELQGTTALALILSLFIKFFNIRGGKIFTFCDNQSVVRKLQNGWQHWRFRHTKGADGDLQAVLGQITEEMRQVNGIHQNAEWVQGHQDDGNVSVLTRQATLNIQMDEEAKQAYNLPNQWQAITYVPVFRAEVCAVYIGGNKVTSNVQLSLSEQWHEQAARQYLLERHNITTELYPTIYWRSLRVALKKLSAHRRAMAVKALHRHLPSQEKLYKQGRIVMSSLCPRCLQADETNSHVYCCMNDTALKQRKADWVDMWKQLSKCKTASIIEQTWRYHLQPILGIALGSSIIEGLPIAYGDVAVLLDLAIREQTAIGWDKLLLGLGSISWRTLQETIDLSNPKAPKRNATDWMNSAIRSLLKFSLRCWKARNVAVHGATKKEQQDSADESPRKNQSNL